MKPLALALLRLYKRWISPSLPASCRYVPTCSEYAMEAVERFGAVRGGAMAVGRLLRCHPLAKGGLDPVVKTIDTSANAAAVASDAPSYMSSHHSGHKEMSY
jgi:uncharacterized protein